MNKTIILEGTTFFLERFSDKFITETYVEWLRDKEIGKTIIHGRSSVTINDVRQYCETMIQDENIYFFAIVLKEGDRHIGNIKIGPIDRKAKSARLGMMIGDRQQHGKGIGAEVVALSKHFAFDILGLQCLFLEVIDENQSAIRVYEKNGFTVIGSESKYYSEKNKTYKIYQMEVLNVNFVDRE